MLDEEDSKNSGIDETAPPITPSETCTDGWQDQTHEKDDLEVILVLPDDDGVLVEIGDVGASNTLWVLLHKHPSEVGIDQALSNGIGIFFGVGVTMMSSVVSGPPSDGTFDGTTADGSKEDSERQSGRIRGMCPESVITCGDAQTGGKVIQNGPDGGLCLEGDPEGLDTAIQGNSDDEVDVEPVDVLVPVGACHGGVGDMDLLGVIGGVSVGL